MSAMASRLFAQPFVQAQIKEIIKAPSDWPLWGESTGDRRIPFTKGQSHGNCFHLMTSSCYIHEYLGCLAAELFWRTRNIHLQFISLVDAVTRVEIPNRVILNLLWASDAIRQQKSGSTLVQVMACCLTHQSITIDQCWLLICGALRHSCERNFTPAENWCSIQQVWKSYFLNHCHISLGSMSWTLRFNGPWFFRTLYTRIVTNCTRYI